MFMKNPKNIAFIDGQNLHLGTLYDNWKVDLRKFYIYLKDKYKIKHAYYYLGTIQEDKQDLYDRLQKSGFIIRFKEHTQNLVTEKKGNVDSDIIFEIMKELIENPEDFERVFLVSGDGDYKKLGGHFVGYLGEKGIRKKIEYIK